MDEELEKIINEINGNLSDRLFMKEKNEDELFVVFRDDIKYAEFQGEFGKKARSIKELKPLFDYLDKNGYTYHLN